MAQQTPAEEWAQKNGLSYDWASGQWLSEAVPDDAFNPTAWVNAHKVDLNSAYNTARLANAPAAGQQTAMGYTQDAAQRALQGQAARAGGYSQESVAQIQPTLENLQAAQAQRQTAQARGALTAQGESAAQQQAQNALGYIPAMQATGEAALAQGQAARASGRTMQEARQTALGYQQGAMDPNDPANSAARNAFAAAQGTAAPGQDVYSQRLQDMMLNGFSPDDPSYQWRLQQGTENLARKSASMGGLGSGAMAVELQEYGQQSASQEYASQFNRLLSASGNATNQYAQAYNTLGSMLNARSANQQVAQGWGNQAQGWEGRAQAWDQQAQGWNNQAQNWNTAAQNWGQQAQGWDRQAQAWNTQGQGWENQAQNWENQARGWDQQAQGWGNQAQAWDRQGQAWEQNNQNWAATAQGWDRQAQGWGQVATGQQGAATQAGQLGVRQGGLMLQQKQFNANEAFRANQDLGAAAAINSGIYQPMQQQTQLPPVPSGYSYDTPYVVQSAGPVVTNTGPANLSPGTGYITNSSGNTSTFGGYTGPTPFGGL